MQWLENISEKLKVNSDEIPFHASKLSLEHQALLNIPTQEEKKSIFDEYYDKHPNSSAGRILEKEVAE